MNQDGPIIVAYDGSPAARAAIVLAGAHLRNDRKVIVLSVYQPLESVPFIGNPVIVIPSGMDDEIHSAAKKLAEEGAELARGHGFEVSAFVAPAQDTVWEAIVDFANDEDASLILMGTRGRSGARYALLGSVASAVMHHAGRPVGVVPEAYVKDGDADVTPPAQGSAAPKA
jgi:nucleotide-binding universal stress UspA family protein